MIRYLFCLALALGLVACDDDDDKKRSNSDPSTTASVEAGLDFRATTGKGVIEGPDNTFAIPACGDDRKLGYITAPWSTPLPAGATFTVSFNVWLSEGAKIVGYEDNSVPTRAALYFQRKSPKKNDPYALAARYYNQGYRQWSRYVREPLTAGDHTFSEVLIADRWTHPDGFAKALADPANIGITLSGTGSAGHGICMAAGSGYVTIYSLTVT